MPITIELYCTWGTSCGGLCGDGVLILLGKDGGEWKVLNRVTIWVS
jgi:hypothetical protein